MNRTPRIAIDYLGDLWIRVPNTILIKHKGLDPRGESWVKNGVSNSPIYHTIEDLLDEVGSLDLYEFHSTLAK